MGILKFIFDYIKETKAIIQFEYFVAEAFEDMLFNDYVDDKYLSKTKKISLPFGQSFISVAVKLVKYQDKYILLVHQFKGKNKKSVCWYCEFYIEQNIQPHSDENPIAITLKRCGVDGLVIYVTNDISNVSDRFFISKRLRVCNDKKMITGVDDEYSMFI